MNLKVDTNQIVKEVLEGIGVDTELSLKDQIDSMMFISMICELEDKFSVEIPDEYLNMDNFQSIDSIVSVISALSEEKTNQNVLS